MKKHNAEYECPNYPVYGSIGITHSLHRAELMQFSDDSAEDSQVFQRWASYQEFVLTKLGSWNTCQQRSLNDDTVKAAVVTEDAIERAQSSGHMKNIGVKERAYIQL